MLKQIFVPLGKVIGLIIVLYVGLNAYQLLSFAADAVQGKDPFVADEQMESFYWLAIEMNNRTYPNHKVVLLSEVQDEYVYEYDYSDKVYDYASNDYVYVSFDSDYITCDTADK